MSKYSWSYEILETLSFVVCTLHSTTELSSSSSEIVRLSNIEEQGFSSLTYLRTLPVDVIKIDQSFVRNMLTDANDRAIVESVIFLAQRFDHPVLAEGVETMDHAAALRDMGCNLVQGYGIARPMPSGEVLEWLQNWRRQVESRKEIQQLQAASEQGEGI